MAGEPFGAWLRQARELRGLSLDDVAASTKIRRTALESLEADDAVNLPSPVFVTGMVRSYARAVGLAPDEAALRYQEHRQAAVGESAGDAEPERARRVWPFVAAAVVAAAAAAALVFLRR